MIREAVRITPSYAEELLLKNIHCNRCISERTVAQFTKDMVSDNWERNGETIKIDDEGRLIDGQHRLSAVIKSNKTICMDIAIGIKPSAFKTIDRGKPRSVADIFKSQGEQNNVLLAATIRWLSRWISRNPIPKLTSRSLTAHEAESLLNKYPNIRNTTSLVAKRNQCLKSVCAPSIVSLACYLFSEKNPNEAETFIDKFCKGHDLPLHHPILVVRNRMITMRRSRSSFPDYDYLALLILAWNNIRRGDTGMKRAYWCESRGGFPMPK